MPNTYDDSDSPMAMVPRYSKRDIKRFAAIAVILFFMLGFFLGLLSG